jgi:maleylacetate reductase
MGVRRVFLLVGSTLREQTGEIRRIEAALGEAHAATWSGISPHAPRSDV